MKNNKSLFKLFTLKKQRSLVIFMGMLLFSFSYGQNDSLIELAHGKDSIIVDQKGADAKYLEDQFYVGLTFNLLDDLPEGGSQSGFSGGFHVGYIRDIPLNKKRNFGIGVGVGWSINSYRSNLLVSENEVGESIFQVLESGLYDYDLNKFGTQLIEVPFQVRWRTSSSDSYKFWRIYAGVRFGYLYHFRSIFKQPTKRIEKNHVDGMNRLRYGLTFSFGFNTFNFTVYYALNPLFGGETTEGSRIGLSPLKIGLEFYLL